MTAKQSIIEKSSASIFVAVAVALAIVGLGRSYEVWQKPAEESASAVNVQGTSLELPPGMADPFSAPPGLGPPPKKKETVQDISDLQLVVEATRTGVTREEDKLYFTGAQKCKT